MGERAMDAIATPLQTGTPRSSFGAIKQTGVRVLVTPPQVSRVGSTHAKEFGSFVGQSFTSHLDMVR